MLNVTKRAKRELKRILTTSVDMPQARLRLMARERGGLGLGVDIESPSDRLVEHDGATVLVVDDKLAMTLEGVTLDIDDTPEGAELVIYGVSGAH